MKLFLKYFYLIKFKTFHIFDIDQIPMNNNLKTYIYFLTENYTIQLV